MCIYVCVCIYVYLLCSREEISLIKFICPRFLLTMLRFPLYVIHFNSSTLRLWFLLQKVVLVYLMMYLSNKWTTKVHLYFRCRGSQKSLKAISIESTFQLFQNCQIIFNSNFFLPSPASILFSIFTLFYPFEPNMHPATRILSPVYRYVCVTTSFSGFSSLKIKPKFFVVACKTMHKLVAVYLSGFIFSHLLLRGFVPEVLNNFHIF